MGGRPRKMTGEFASVKEKVAGLNPVEIFRADGARDSCKAAS